MKIKFFIISILIAIANSIIAQPQASAQAQTLDVNALSQTLNSIDASQSDAQSKLACLGKQLCQGCKPSRSGLVDYAFSQNSNNLIGYINASKYVFKPLQRAPEALKARVLQALGAKINSLGFTCNQ